MEELLQIAPQLAFAVFLFYVFRWSVGHFDPYISRLLNNIDDIRETGQRMADIGERFVLSLEKQQSILENLDTTLLERHKRVMERFDRIEAMFFHQNDD